MNKGFTIIEVLVAILLFSLSLLALAKMQVFGTRATGFNKQATEATALAQTVIESYRGAAFGTDPAACGTTTANGYTIQCSRPATGTTPNRYEDVTVTITWDNPQKTISLFTVVTER